ncbi:unnamed protein product [Pedinophyceae sp. YPF-701]|nr:unnamed protein product [Pedinophyceae sp. YPF-701]
MASRRRPSVRVEPPAPEHRADSAKPPACRTWIDISPAVAHYNRSSIFEACDADEALSLACPDARASHVFDIFAPTAQDRRTLPVSETEGPEYNFGPAPELLLEQSGDSGTGDVALAVHMMDLDAAGSGVDAHKPEVASLRPRSEEGPTVRVGWETSSHT